MAHAPGCGGDVPGGLAGGDIWLYRGRQGYHSRWVQMACYLFYPVHILVLAMMVRFLL